MKQLACLVILASLIAPLNCSAKDKGVMNSQKVRELITHYFSANAKIADGGHTDYLSGDFNGDGLVDVAVLFYPPEKMTPAEQVTLSRPWTFGGRIKSRNNHKSLARS